MNKFTLYRSLIPLLEKDVGIMTNVRSSTRNRDRCHQHLQRNSYNQSSYKKRSSTPIYIAQTTPYRSSLTNAFSTYARHQRLTPPVEIRCLSKQNVSEPDSYGFIKANTTLSCTVFNNSQSLYERILLESIFRDRKGKSPVGKCT